MLTEKRLSPAWNPSVPVRHLGGQSATLQNPILHCDQRRQVFRHVAPGLPTEAALLGPSVFAAFAFEYLNRLAGSRVQETGKQTRLFAAL
jgi:hypothetical protein